eukprot:1012010-Amphidinium_carterae.1
MDDLVVHGNVATLAEVLLALSKRLQHFGLKLNPDKCQLWMPSSCTHALPHELRKCVPEDPHEARGLT